METKKLDIVGGDYQKNIDAAAKILKNGGIVAVPTETVYGLAASAVLDEPIINVFKAKGRPQDNPLIVHISDMDMLEKIAAEIPKSAKKCAEKFWPGPFTMVLKRTDYVSNRVCAGLDTVAVRCPSEKSIRDIIKASGIPLAAPSANISGAPSPTTYSHVINDLDGKIDAVVCGEDCLYGVESTVVALFGEHPRLLRPGAVTLEELREVLPDIEVDKAILEEPEKDEKVASPGMKYKHYAPKTEAFLVEADEVSFADFVNKKEDCLALCFAEESELITVEKKIYGKKTDEFTLAKNLFSALRSIDNLNKKAVYIHAPSKSGVGLAVYNRLIRACAFRVIKL
ncbi:MAG: threonylcarbamoyl-AMP synthase [Clostridia bacterium]|nr:threonylcarbamoyl-AMP synthase [Clostridia bacterium]